MELTDEQWAIKRYYTVPFIPDLPSAFSGMAQGRRFGGHSMGVGPGFAATRRTGSQQVFHRWQRCHRQKGGHDVGKVKRGKGTKLMAEEDRNGLPLAICTDTATPHEVTLVLTTLQACFLDTQPASLIGDKAYDSDPLDRQLAEQGIDMIAPHRRNRRKPRTQDGHKLCR